MTLDPAQPHVSVAPPPVPTMPFCHTQHILSERFLAPSQIQAKLREAAEHDEVVFSLQRRCEALADSLNTSLATSVARPAPSTAVARTGGRPVGWDDVRPAMPAVSLRAVCASTAEEEAACQAVSLAPACVF